jgi:hypothetical protein
MTRTIILKIRFLVLLPLGRERVGGNQWAFSVWTSGAVQRDGSVTLSFSKIEHFAYEYDTTAVNLFA